MDAAPKTSLRPGLTRVVTVSLLLVIVATGLLLWLRPDNQSEAEYLVFGTRARVQLRAPSREQADAALSEIGRTLARDHRAWHAWEPSELTRLNADLEAGKSRRVPADLARMIVEAKRGYRLSGGLFNPAAGKLIGAWGFHTSRYPVESPAPRPVQVQALLQAAPGMDEVQVAADGTVSSQNPALALDLNGLAEGFAALQVRELLRRHGIDEAMIYIGGFVLAVGENGREPWRIGINAPEGVLGMVELRDGEALSSSGDYQRRRTGTQAAGHIIDARAGRPQRASVATSVVSQDPVLADMAATALMVAGPENFERQVTAMGLSCALLLGHDGTLHITEPLRQRLHLHGLNTQALRVHGVAGHEC